MNKKFLSLGELFCGPGGVARGALDTKLEVNGQQYGYKHAWANDYDFDTCQTYAENICNGDSSTVFCEDVRKLDISKLSPINIFAFGFPCNDFSIVGEQKGIKGEFGPLYTYGVKILNKYDPDFFVAENVKGLSSANNGKAFKMICRELEKAGKKGYKLTAHLYKFEDYGVPQQRHRIIIVGVNNRLNKEFQVPAPTTKGKPVTCKQAICSPKIPKNATNNELTKQSPTVVKRLQHIKPGQNVWTADLPKELQLNVKGAKLSQIYKRLDPDKPSYTITGSGGGGTHGYHWSEDRALTNRERARIQTFPDDYVFSGSKESVRKQIGMAVPPTGTTVIFEAILKTLNGIQYDSVPAHF